MCGVPYPGVRMLQVLGGWSCGCIVQWLWGAQGGEKLHFTQGSNSSPALGFHVDSINQASFLGACWESASSLGTLLAVYWDVQATVPPPRVEINFSLEQGSLVYFCSPAGVLGEDQPF